MTTGDIDIVERLRATATRKAERIGVSPTTYYAWEAANEIERLRKALELIAGSATDKLQALQAKNALDNI